MKTELIFTIGAQEAVRQEGTFTVPVPCRHLCLKHDLSPQYTLLVFLMIKDPKGKVRFLKLLGFSEPVISLGTDAFDTTIGGVPGEISAGSWQVSVFLFSESLEKKTGGKRIPFKIEVSDECADITECIGKTVWKPYDFSEIYQKGARWYKGDLHTHTRLSDGEETPETASRKAELMNLDYYIPTEHNALHTGWPETEVLILPGIEITTKLGHANLFGVDQTPNMLEAILEDRKTGLLEQDLLGVLEECREKGWLFSVNHPFLYIWKWLYGELPLSGVSCLEIINDPTYEADPEAEAREANQKAVFLSDLLWEDGYRICAVGGSDSHKKIDEFYPGASEPSIPGDPATFLYMKDLSPAHILEALKNCRAYVTRHCEIESSVNFGEQLDRSVSSLTYEIWLKGQKNKPKIFYIYNGVRYTCETCPAGDDTWRAAGEILLDGGAYQWIRFGAEQRDGSFLFYGNPVTRGKKAHRFETFKDAKEELEKRWRKHDKGNPV